MKGVKKVISILVRIISIVRMKLLMLSKAKKPDHFDLLESKHNIFPLVGKANNPQYDFKQLGALCIIEISY
jgi:hypothetical protein